MKVLSEKNLERTKNILRNNGKSSIPEKIFIQSQDTKYNRKILEYGKFFSLLDIHKASENRDKPKFLDSGLNHIQARIATKNSITLAFDLKKIKSLSKLERAKVLARIEQNIKIAKKAKTKVLLLNIQNEKNAFYLAQALGMSSKEAEKAVSQNKQ
jgi:hypothetical protein